MPVSGLRIFYGFKARGFKAYITSAHHDPETKWMPDKDDPWDFISSSLIPRTRTTSPKIYLQWQKENLAERPSYSKADAMTKAFQSLFEKEFKKAKEESR